MDLCCGTIAVGASRIRAGSSLASLEAPTPAHAEENEQPSGPSVTVVTVPSQAQPTLRLVVDNTRTSQPDLGPDETRRSA
jgi:hypothetical protein